MSVQAHGGCGSRECPGLVTRLLNLKILHQNSPQSDPMGEDFNYAEEFKSLDLNAVIKDLHALMTASQGGGQPILATTAGCSSGWRGTVQVLTASPTAVAAGIDQ